MLLVVDIHAFPSLNTFVFTGKHRRGKFVFSIQVEMEAAFDFFSVLNIISDSFGPNSKEVALEPAKEPDNSFPDGGWMFTDASSPMAKLREADSRLQFVPYTASSQSEECCDDCPEDTDMEQLLPHTILLHQCKRCLKHLCDMHLTSHTGCKKINNVIHH